MTRQGDHSEGARFGRLSAAAGALFASLLLGACSSPDGSPATACELLAWFRPAALVARADLDLTRAQVNRAELVGSWNGWATPGSTNWTRVVAADGTEWYGIRLSLPPGTHRYAIRIGPYLIPGEVNGQTSFITDPYTPGAAPWGTEVSQAQVPDCAAPQLRIDSVAIRGESFTVRARLEPGHARSPLVSASARATLRRGPDQIPGIEVAVAADGTIRAGASGLAPGKYTVTLDASDAAGQAAATATVTAFLEPSPVPGSDGAPGLADGLVYQIVLDRFRGDTGPLAPPTSPGDRAGGTLAGVTAAIEAGYFERLGVTTLWLSPLYRNPAGHHVGRDGRMYEAYHGYWPAEPRAVEPRLGGEIRLDALVAAAHARGLRVIADAVPNHVYESHPYYREHSRQAPAVAGAPDPDQASWFHDAPPIGVCGRAGIGWTLECWFDDYLPDLNWRHPEVVTQGVADLRWWMERFDLDGLRIDAVPLMPRAATRRMVRAVRDLATRGAGLDQLMIGEVYTGPGQAGRTEIAAYLGNDLDGLDSAFDFPLMWETRRILAWGQGSMQELESELAASTATWQGSGAVMANFLDNHDTPRFLSEAVGDAWGDPWTSPARQPEEAEPYLRHILGLAFVLTLPGLPVLYYGDEVGLAGANDPDSRRVMPDVLGDNLPPLMGQVLRTTERLGQLRRCLPALRRGTRRALLIHSDHLVSLHQPPAGSSSSPALVVLSRSRTDARLEVAGVPPGNYRDVLSGTRLRARDGFPTAVFISALAPAIFVLEEDPCLVP